MWHKHDNQRLISIFTTSQNFRSYNKSTVSEDWNKTESVAPVTQHPSKLSITLMVFEVATVSHFSTKTVSNHIIPTSITISEMDWAVSLRYRVNVRFVLLSINVTFTFYLLLFVDMFRPHTAIFRCDSILSRSWCSAMPIFCLCLLSVKRM
jgi:hypothetical protein